MNDEHGSVQALSISWAEPDLDGRPSAWDGPSPDAPRHRPTSVPEKGPDEESANARGGLSGAWESSHAAHAEGEAQSSTDDVDAPLGHPVTPVSSPRESAPVGWAPSARETTPDDHSAPAPTPLDGPPVEVTDEPRRTGSTAYVAPPVQDAPRGYDQSFMDEPAEPRADRIPSESPLTSRDAPGAAPVDSSGSSEASATPPQVVSQHEDLPEDSLTIGRSRNNSIVLDDMLVSRRHVVITADEQGLLLRDLGSRNGTFVNGRRVEQTHLHEGDRIGIGASTFEVRDGWLVSV